MRKYLTPVFDFIMTEDNQVKLLEMGGGICGSGFPGYDCSHDGESVRHLMLKGLAKKVAKLFLVNVAENYLFELFGESLLKELGNVYYFESFSAFVMYAKLNREDWHHSAVIFDRISASTSFRENNYETLLEAFDIHIPVVNAGPSSFFQNKVSFPLLFTGDLATAIPNTKVISKKNYLELLKKLDQEANKKFVILPASGAHSQGTLLVDQQQLALICDICFKQNEQVLDGLRFSPFEIKVLHELINMTNSEDKTFVIRELVIPKLVHCYGKNYRCVGRAAFCAVYDNENKLIDLQHLTSFWQNAKESSSDTELSGETLITYDQDIPGFHVNIQQQAAYLNSEQFQFYRNFYSQPADFSQDELAISLPVLNKVVGKILKTICRKSLVEHFEFYTKVRVEPEVQHYIFQFRELPVQTVSTLYTWLENNSPDYLLFLINQLAIHLSELALVPHSNLFAPLLYKQVNSAMKKYSTQLIQDNTKLAKMFMSYAKLNFEIKNKLSIVLMEARCDSLLGYFRFMAQNLKVEVPSQSLLISQNDLQAVSLLDLAFDHLNKKNFKQALLSFQKFYDLMKSPTLNNEIKIAYLENVSLCHFSLGNYAEAVASYRLVFLHGNDNMKINMRQHKYTKCLEAWKNHEKALEAYKSHDYDSAKAFWELALKHFEQNISGSGQVAICYSNLASCRRELKDFDLAMNYCDKALAIYRSLSIPENDDRIQKIMTKQTQIKDLKNGNLQPSVSFTNQGKH